MPSQSEPQPRYISKTPKFDQDVNQPRSAEGHFYLWSLRPPRSTDAGRSEAS
jgi:hypothetical protein